MEKQFNVGDEVRVVALGECYSDFSPWAKTHQLPNFKKGRKLTANNPNEGVVIKKARHLNDKSKIIYGVCIDGNSYIFNADGLELVNQATEKVNITQHKHAELIKRWADDTSLVILFEDPETNCWQISHSQGEPLWLTKNKYYLVPECHVEVALFWLNNKDSSDKPIIELKNKTTPFWARAISPSFYAHIEYRKISNPVYKDKHWYLVRSDDTWQCMQYVQKENAFRASTNSVFDYKPTAFCKIGTCLGAADETS